jgi:predicted dinucleotide-utilizing enzyme
MKYIIRNTNENFGWEIQGEFNNEQDAIDGRFKIIEDMFNTWKEQTAIKAEDKMREITELDSIIYPEIFEGNATDVIIEAASQRALDKLWTEICESLVIEEVKNV